VAWLIVAQGVQHTEIGAAVPNKEFYGFIRAQSGDIDGQIMDDGHRNCRTDPESPKPVPRLAMNPHGHEHRVSRA